MTLTEQCELLKLDLIDIKLKYSGYPEPAALQYFEQNGYIGTCNEGTMILTILKALMLDKLSELNIFRDRNDACCRYLEAQFTILENNIDYIIKSISMTKRDQFIDNFKEIINQPFIQKEHPGNSVNVAVALFDATDTNTFINLAKKFSEDPYTYRSGWPDLTLVKDSKVYLIEVKTTDNLHNSQLKTIPAFKEVLPYDFSVLRIS